jgi:capsid assembly protease
MKLLDILTSAWAIQPEKLHEIQAIYATHFRGEKIDIEAIEARLNRPLANDQQDYQLREGGIAVLAIDGVIAPKANLFTRVSGGASAQMLTTQVESAIADPRVKAMVLAIDSPGGSVFGTPELAAAIRELSAIKPIVTVSEATIASAAYWIGSAANAVFVSGPTVQVGSIGVVANHTYNPRSAGSPQTTEITAGRYKRIASDTAPLSDEGKAYLQAQVDHLYSVFVDTVAQHRGTTADAVLEHMADGRVFIGQQAIDAGLVDGVSTVDAMVEKLATNPDQFAKRRKAVFAMGGLPVLSAGDAPNHNPTEKESVMPTADISISRESLERDHAALFAQLRSEFTALGAQGERERIQAIEAVSIPGHEKLIAQLKFDGKSTGGDAAQAVLAAERTVRENQAKALATDAPNPLAQVPAATVDTGAAAQAVAAAEAEANLPLEDRCKAAWDRDPKVRSEFITFDAYCAYEKASARGGVKVLGKKTA